MSSKRKFSATFETDLATTQNLMKYRKTATDPNSSNVSPIPVNQRELRHTTDSILRGYESLDGNCNVEIKPNYTYTEMIFMSLLRSPNYCLPISEIYSYIETRFAYFLEVKEQQWKNAVRQSLKKNKCFQKLGIDNHNPRCGILNRSAFLWTLLPRCLLTFARGDYRMKKGPTLDLFPRKCNRFSEGCIKNLRERIDAFQSILNQTSNPAKLYGLQVCNIDGEDSGLLDSEFGSNSSESCYNNAFTQILQPLFEENTVSKNGSYSPNDSAFSDNDSSIDAYPTIDISANSGYQSAVDISATYGYQSINVSTNETCQSASELSHLEFQFCHNFLSPASDKYMRGFFTNTGSGSLPELRPECIDSVPCIPDIPALNLSPIKRDEEDCTANSINFEDFITFGEDECLSKMLTEEDFSILQEFLCI